MCVGLFVRSAVVFHVFLMFFHVLIFYVGLLMCGCVIWVGLYYSFCTDLFSCIAASLFNKLTCLILGRQFCAESNMNQLDDSKRTPLMYAVSSGWPHVVEYLLDRGADSSLVDERHTTALMQACSLGLQTIVRLLLNNGASIDDTCMVRVYSVRP